MQTDGFARAFFVPNMSKFGAIPTEVICHFHELAKTEIIVLSALFACRNHTSGRCNPSYSQLEEMVGVAKPHIGRAIRSLRKSGWLSRSKDGHYSLPTGDQIRHGKGDQNGHSRSDQNDAQGVTKSVSKGDQNEHLHIYGLNNERTTKEQRIERERPAPATDDNRMVSIYQEFFPRNPLSIGQQEMIVARVSDEKRWREALTFWHGNDYRAQSIFKICGYYDELLAGKHDGNGKKSNTGKRRSEGDDQSTDDFLRSIGANPAR
jgi:DNA replication protein DnaD